MTEIYTKYRKISKYIAKILSDEKQIEILEWVIVPFVEYPIVVRCDIVGDYDIDKLEMKMNKYLKNGLQVLIRPKKLAPIKKVQKIMTESEHLCQLDKNYLPKKINRIVNEIIVDASKWLRKNSIEYICIYEIIFEQQNEILYGILSPQKNKKGFTKIGDREICYLPESSLASFMNLLYMIKYAHQQKKSFMQYLKDII
ncbi:hypothetical protein A2533_00940 [Candidatus Falkowbacteria bacterium RIFOXYD2_FULL_35_9]|uniref:Uncharacterized protein n=1 Tax=Candidatus Falkowbacteria bacterium RIFOXYC2_FULL_36_12 TaxID=1798002 RepID=A0A1F5SYR6_9BACT|nr:MAG: hypothetical protein A2300_03350 [Candidatus Falkowbacteria bacterium RIFOXYB2_FULL_35_7]OGF31854.1 MAG: hypothetical protein A2478_05215 [Candidatus Falkowbacteria bacterium RIFOXYC2_FULL_36_12]OGF34624.1 MAG: hypothetical protein A2223_00560 [Candidatus Falkowbacteria bacterium RIFOXYA2_FULL_35_8]OGF45841.1 MAG: hypothetical protein A2533_00940 [Candidatus Falkowbacteria bacterium RIFOXYD2_FULL_35_9]